MLVCLVNFLFSLVTVSFYFSSIVKLRFFSTFVLINEYECVDPVHTLHRRTNNFPTVYLD